MRSRRGAQVNLTSSASMRNIRLGLFSILLISLPVRLYCQSTFGRIVGKVQDPSGLLIPAVTVSVRNLNDNANRSTITNSDGEYQVAQSQTRFLRDNRF